MRSLPSSASFLDWAKLEGPLLPTGASWWDDKYSPGCDDIEGRSGGRSVGGERLAWYWSTFSLQARLILFHASSLFLFLARTRCNYRLLRFRRSTWLFLFTPILRGKTWTFTMLSMGAILILFVRFLFYG